MTRALRSAAMKRATPLYGGFHAAGSAPTLSLLLTAHPEIRAASDVQRNAVRVRQARHRRRRLLWMRQAGRQNIS